MSLNVDPEVNFEEIVSDDGNITTRGYYTYPDNVVTINELYLNELDSYQIMKTMIHEMRHAYQHAAIDNPVDYVVSEETLSEWEENFENYINANKDGYKNYASQPVEYDAKSFAEQYKDLNNITPSYSGSWK